MLQLMKLRLVIEFDPEAKRWSAVFPELSGCASVGDTEEEAIANARKGLALWFEPADIPLPTGAKVFELALPGAGGSRGSGRQKADVIDRKSGNPCRRRTIDAN